MSDYIAYNTNGEHLAVGLGGSSKFEINAEKRIFDGLNKISKIEDLPIVKITFYELSTELIDYLKNSTAANSVLFINRDSLYNGYYQSHCQQDEFKKEIVLTLYFVKELGIEPLPTITYLEQGLPMVNPFGKGNFKINSVEVPAYCSYLEKNTNTNIEKFRFANGYKYYFEDETAFKIVINGAVKNGLIENSIKTLKNSMVSFQPHIDNDQVYTNLYFDYEIKVEEQKSRIEIELKMVK